jgi:hypothetical protein
MSIELFLTPHYDRHNRRRQEHLASLRINIQSKSVLEVGAGIGDHSSFFIDRGCNLTCTDGRAELLALLKEKYSSVKIIQWNVEEIPPEVLEPNDIVYAYGVLYHTKNPELVIENFSTLCKETLLLETCVSFGEDSSINLVEENLNDPTQALDGIGCRPTRRWVFEELKKYFPFVYNTLNQPAHEEFPLEWNEITSKKYGPNALVRSVFIASRIELDNIYLAPYLINEHIKS